MVDLEFRVGEGSKSLLYRKCFNNIFGAHIVHYYCVMTYKLSTSALQGPHQAPPAPEVTRPRRNDGRLSVSGRSSSSPAPTPDTTQAPRPARLFSPSPLRVEESSQVGLISSIEAVTL